MNKAALCDWAGVMEGKDLNSELVLISPGSEPSLSLVALSRATVTDDLEGICQGWAL